MSVATEIQRLQTAKANIKSAIENKGVIVGDGTIDTYAEKIDEISVGGSGDYDQGYEDGKNSVVNPHEYAKGIAEGYYGVAFPEGYELTLNLPNITSLSSAFYSATGIKKIVIKGNTAGNTVVLNRAFREVRSLEVIDLTEFDAKFGGEATMMCYYNTALVEILGELDFSAVTSFNSTFSGCTNLVTFTPRANTIKISISFAGSNKLSNLSIQSIFDGLATVDTAQTLTLHKNLKILQTQVDSANAKGWTVAGGTVVSEEEYYG